MLHTAPNKRLLAADALPRCLLLKLIERAAEAQRYAATLNSRRSSWLCSNLYLKLNL
jgi:hypothetical protein